MILIVVNPILAFDDPKSFYASSDTKDIYKNINSLSEKAEAVFLCLRTSNWIQNESFLNFKGVHRVISHRFHAKNSSVRQVFYSSDSCVTNALKEIQDKQVILCGFDLAADVLPISHSLFRHGFKSVWCPSNTTSCIGGQMNKNSVLETMNVFGVRTEDFV